MLETSLQIESSRLQLRHGQPDDILATIDTDRNLTPLHRKPGL